MYCHKLKLLALIIIVAVFSSCKKDSLLDDGFDRNVKPINIPASIEIDPARPDTASKYIVVIGSSTAAGYGASVRDSCWVARLRNKLVADKKRFKVINLAVGGYSTYKLMPNGYISDIAKRPEVDTNKNVTAALKYHPALIIINLPSNDIAANYRDEEILKNYRTIARTIASDRVDYIITGTQPRNFPTAEQRKRLKILNDKMNVEYPGHLDDYFKKLSTSTYGILRNYSAGDGIHLNNNGHRVIYQSVLNFPVFKTVADYK
jgi:acyl-CoA thioesterase-1